METTRGFSSFANFISLQMTSEAKALPPGELTRSTMAFTSSSFRALRRAFEISSDPIELSLPCPERISPRAYMTAILSFFSFSATFSY